MPPCSICFVDIEYLPTSSLYLVFVNGPTDDTSMVVGSSFISIGFSHFHGGYFILRISHDSLTVNVLQSLHFEIL